MLHESHDDSPRTVAASGHRFKAIIKRGHSSTSYYMYFWLGIPAAPGQKVWIEMKSVVVRPIWKVHPIWKRSAEGLLLLMTPLTEALQELGNCLKLLAFANHSVFFRNEVNSFVCFFVVVVSVTCKVKKSMGDLKRQDAVHSSLSKA